MVIALAVSYTAINRTQILLFGSESLPTEEIFLLMELAARLATPMDTCMDASDIKHHPCIDEDLDLRCFDMNAIILRATSSERTTSSTQDTRSDYNIYARLCPQKRSFE